MSHAPMPSGFVVTRPPGWETLVGAHTARIIQWRSESLSDAGGTLVALQVYTGFYGPYRGLNERASHTHRQGKQKTPTLARQRLEHEKQKTSRPKGQEG